MTPYVVVLVHGTPGRTLPNGTPNGVGGKVEYQAAITTDGIDRQPVGPMHPTPREAYRYAERLERRLQKENLA